MNFSIDGRLQGAYNECRILRNGKADGMDAKVRGAGPLGKLYDEAGLAQDIRRSLNFILLGNIMGNLNAIICGGGTAAMVGLANQLQAGDFAFGLLNGIPQAAALLQIPFSILVNRTHKRKKYMLTFGLFSRFLWLLFGFIPLVVPQNPAGLQLWTLIFLLGISSCCSAAINVCWFPWFSDLAPINIRSRWLSMRDMVVAGCNMAFGLLVAQLLDTLPPDSRYVIIFLLGGTVGMIDMVCFGFCKEVYATPAQRTPLKQVLRDIAGNKPFLRLVVMWTAWCFTANLCAPYLNRYSLNEMGLSFTQMMVFGNVAGSVASMLMIRRWGMAMHRFGSRSVMLVSASVVSVADAFYLTSVPGSIWPVLLRYVIGAMFWSGSNLAANSMQLSTSPDGLRPSYIAVFSSVTSLVGTALGTVVGGALLEGFQGIQMFSVAFDRYKALIVLSVALRVLVVIFLVPPMENDRDGTPRQLLQQMLPLRRR